MGVPDEREGLRKVRRGKYRLIKKDKITGPNTFRFSRHFRWRLTERGRRFKGRTATLTGLQVKYVTGEKTLETEPSAASYANLGKQESLLND